MKRRTTAYAAAGVDIALGNRVKATLPELLASTHRREVLGKVGGFGGLFALDTRKYREPVLVSSVDGVGTKLKIAFAMDRHDTIGQDLVNHCVNDIAVLGAEPLFFLDYLGTGKLEPRVFTEIIQGFAKACAENRCALIGGETAQMPGFYAPGEYDVSGTIVGVVERSRMLNGQKSVRPGDVVLGVASSGLHTNGYSLARRIFFEQMKLKPSSRMPELGGTLGDELLKVHVSYGPLVQALRRRFDRPAAKTGSGVQSPTSNVQRSTFKARSSESDVRGSKSAARVPAAPGPIHAFAHITGGGFVDNIPRVLPAGCDVQIRKGSWPVPPVFRLLEAEGGLEEHELYQVFNMGIGMVALVAAGAADAVLRAIIHAGHAAWMIGEVRRGMGRVLLA